MDIRDRPKVKAKQTRCIEELENYKTLRNKATPLNRELKQHITQIVFLIIWPIWKGIKQILPLSPLAQI